MADKTNSPLMTNGFHLVVDALKLNGVDTIYGVAGIPVTDLARLAQASGIRYIGFRHEQSAGNAAAISGYLTQKPAFASRFRRLASSTAWWPWRTPPPTVSQ